jgi:hypothetical protein
MLYREIIAVCAEIHTKRINTLCGQNVEFFKIISLVLHIVTVGPCRLVIESTFLKLLQMYLLLRKTFAVHWHVAVRDTRLPFFGSRNVYGTKYDFHSTRCVRVRSMIGIAHA